MILFGLMLAAAAPDCTKAVTQADMNICSGLRAKRADAALNAAWQKRTATLGALKPAFLSAQRAWLRFRDAECEAEGAIYSNGSLRPLVVSDCYADLTEQRAERLRDLTGTR